MARAGFAFNDNIAIEVEAGFGAARSKFTTSGGGVDGDIGIDNPLGAHLVLSSPMNGGAYFMGKIGYVSAKISREYLGYTPPDLDLSGVSYGLGAGIRNGPWDYRMEYSLVSEGRQRRWRGARHLRPAPLLATRAGAASTRLRQPVEVARRVELVAPAVCFLHAVDAETGIGPLLLIVRIAPRNWPALRAIDRQAIAGLARKHLRRGSALREDLESRCLPAFSASIAVPSPAISCSIA